MRLIPIAGLALTGLMLSSNALACDHMIAATQNEELAQPGKYCLSANRNLPVRIHGADIELDCRGKSIVDTSGGDQGPGIAANSTGQVTVRNCRIEAFAEGIVFNASSGDQLINNTIVRPRYGAINVTGQPYAPPEVIGPKLSSNRVIDYGHDVGQIGARFAAIRITGASRAVLANNVVVAYALAPGVRIDAASDVQLNGNQFLDFPDDTFHVIELHEAPRARLAHNTIMLRRIGDAWGVFGAAGATCVENVFINTRYPGFSDCAVTRYNVDQPGPPPQP